MKSASLKEIEQYCNVRLGIPDFPDFDGAANGLQVSNQGKVTRIAAAVDASYTTIEKAADGGADLLLVHHGLFWSPSHPWTGRRYELLRLLLDSNLAVYSAHLPLDAHPLLGNNSRLCAALGLKKLSPFFFEKGVSIGFRADAKINRQELKRRLEKATGESALLIPGGSEICRKIGVVSGGAGSSLKKAAQEGVDTFITGEGSHWTYAAAEDLGLNVLYGGHYATETFGVKALAGELSKKYNLPWIFVDHPTGL